MGMVDRGADLTWLSQYPHEQEVLFPPLTGLEALSTEVDGNSLLVITRLSLNMASLTLEQVLSRRRKMLMDMAAGMKGELRWTFKNNPKLAETGPKILQEALNWGQFSQPHGYFNDDNNFLTAVQQALGARSAVMQSCLRLPLDVKEVSLSQLRISEYESCRVLVLAGWLRTNPAATSIDFRDVGLSTEEAEMLAVEAAKLPKLCNLNVLRNETMGKQGALALAKCLSKGGCGGALKSLCGIGVGTAANSLEVPRKELEPIDALVFAAELMCNQWSESLGNETNQARKFARLMRKGRVDGSTGWYPLIWAARDGNNALVVALIESGVFVDQSEADKHDAGFTPLMCAAIKGHAKTVELLLERGADTELADHHKKTAAMHAEARGFKAIKALIDYCAEQAKQQNQTSFGNVIARAAFIKTAVANFKASLGAVNPTVEADKVGPAANKMIAAARGRTVRKEVAETAQVVEEAAKADPSAVQSLATRAMLTQKAAARLKAAIVPGGTMAKNALKQQERRIAAEEAEAIALAEAEAEAEKEAAERAAKEAAAAAAAKPELKTSKTTTLAATPRSAVAAGTPRSKTLGVAEMEKARGGPAAAATSIQRLARGKSGRIKLAAKDAPKAEEPKAEAPMAEAAAPEAAAAPPPEATPEATLEAAVAAVAAAPEAARAPAPPETAAATTSAPSPATPSAAPETPPASTPLVKAAEVGTAAEQPVAVAAPARAAAEPAAEPSATAPAQER